MDAYCVMCGEPWDYLGVRHGGDMKVWEFTLFREGAGCPVCKGKPDILFELTELKHTELGDEDPMIRLNAFEQRDEGTLPEWKCPEPKVLWSCEGCGVQVRKTLDIYPGENDLEYYIPPLAKCHQWFISHPFHNSSPPEEPTYTFNGGETICEFCLHYCYSCEAPLAPNLESSDVYDDFACFQAEGYFPELFCLECLESICSECGGLPDDCECK